MDSPSGPSSNSSGLHLSGSEGDLQQLMDQRKRKRMISNRESARRSRLRKQKQLDDLIAHVVHLRKENQQILNALNVTSQQYLNVESDNSILRAQANELSNRLESLKEIANFVSNGDCIVQAEEELVYGMDELYGFVNNTLNCISQQPNNVWNCLSQPISMASASADTAFLR